MIETLGWIATAVFVGSYFFHTLYVNQQGVRGSLPYGPRDRGSVTYAIYGPFENRGFKTSLTQSP